jgi:hypothetical protein
MRALCVELNIENSMLFHRGLPEKSIPLRLDTGDIILMNIAKTTSRFIKLFTWCQWDHVGIVIRWKNNRLRLLEATAEGVTLYNLNEVLAEGDTKIAVRRLRVERSKELVEKCYTFLHDVRGRPFKKITQMGEMVKAAYGDHSDSKDNKTSLFCSQLAAAMYQAVDLIPADVASNEFTPKDWSDKNHPRLGHLEKGAVLERKLIFPQKQKAKKASKPKQEKEKSKRRFSFGKN